MVKFGIGVSLEEISLRLMVAILIGGIIGYERGRANRPAGFCTHILVCLGASIVAMIQDNIKVYLTNYVLIYSNAQNYLDSYNGRMGEKIVSGLGFLGAGAIMHGRGVIKGLTTAASIWITGCIGFGIGLGYYKLGIISGILGFIVLGFFQKIEHRYIEHRVLSKVIIKFYDNDDYEEDLKQTHKIFSSMKVKIKKIRKNEKENSVHYTLKIPKQLYGLDFMANVSKYKYIKDIKVL